MYIEERITAIKHWTLQHYCPVEQWRVEAEVWVMETSSTIYSCPCELSCQRMVNAACRHTTCGHSAGSLHHNVIVIL